MSWSGFATNFVFSTQDGNWASEVIVFDSGSQETWATLASGALKEEEATVSWLAEGERANQ